MPYAKLINGESWHLVTNGPVEFEKYLIQIQDFWKIINHLEEFLNWIKKYRKMSTYNQFILELIGSQPIMPKNLPRQYFCTFWALLTLGLTFNSNWSTMCISCEPLSMFISLKLRDWCQMIQVIYPNIVLNIKICSYNCQLGIGENRIRTLGMHMNSPIHSHHAAPYDSKTGPINANNWCGGWRHSCRCIRLLGFSNTILSD